MRIWLLLLAVCFAVVTQAQTCPAVSDFQIVITNVTANPPVVIETKIIKACCCVVDSSSPDFIKCVQPTPTPTPTPSPTPSPTPTPVPTPTPIPVTVVTFDPPPGDCCDVAGVFNGIDWGNNQWAWRGPLQSFKTNNWFFSSPTGTSRKITFVQPQTLVSVDVITDQGGFLTISDEVGQRVTTVVSPGPLVTIVTKWAKPSKIVTFVFAGSDGKGWHVSFDNLAYQ